MSTLLRNLSRGLSFSHLAKVDPHAADDAPPSDDNKNGKKADEKGPDDKNTDNGDTSGKKGSNAEDDPPPPDDDNKNGKKGKKADEKGPDENADDDDDEEEMRGSSAAALARRRERARCAHIMGSKAAGKNPVLAANLAFKTTMTRKEAEQVLADTPAPAAAAPTERRNPQLGGGGERTVNSQQAVADSWAHVMEKVRPKSKRR